MGLTLEETNEISLLLGRDIRTKIFSISEYNPAIEKYRTGTVVHDLLYHFLIGLSQRLNTEF